MSARADPEEANSVPQDLSYLLAFLGIKHPVVLAPMAGVSGGALAAAVFRAGGLGLIGGGYCDIEWIKAQWAEATGARVGIGFITWALAERPATLDWALDQSPAAVFLSFGDPKPFASRVRRAGCPLIIQIQSVDDAKRALDVGADILVAQGSEAGGHGAARATLPLVPAVVDVAGTVPVLAAGGIADGRGLAAAFMLGASGAVCGTAFFATEESMAHPAAKTAACRSHGGETRRGRVFDHARGLNWPQGWTLRARGNPFEQAWTGRESELTELHRSAYAEAFANGDTDMMAVIVGEAVDLVKSVRPASAIVSDIVTDAARLLDHASNIARHFEGVSCDGS
ncbi:MAG: nitronate monooxygenase [Erythrobacter sp.]|nr:nitronate monooxygenase [Erythrobacter sp.]MDZ4273623.1 nitronate monooxygenase [Erythrobacter sp.]